MAGFVRCLSVLWAGPNTLAALLIAFALRGSPRRVEGVIEFHGPRIAAVLRRLPTPALALTLGHVVFGVSPAALEATRRHERVHVRQYERWGPFFLPAYFAASGWQLLRRRDPYRDNPFEIEAFRLDSAES